MIRYSIIIPHKNCPELLSRCLRSIPYSDEIEVIVVDDNSDDLAELKRLQDSCSDNVRFVYTKDGKGAGYARNVGLSFAIGIWLIFADADDYFTEDAFSKFDSYVEGNSDIVYFTHKSVYSETLEPCERYSVRNNLIIKYDNISDTQNKNNLKYHDVVPWAKMFRRSIITDNLIKFDEVPASNDVMFVVKVAFRSEKIAVSQSPCYVLTYRKGSITRVVNKNNNFSRFKVSLRYNRFLEENKIPVSKIRILSHVLLALKLFGYKEAARYLKELRDNKQSVFDGLLMSWRELKEKASLFFKKDNYQG